MRFIFLVQGEGRGHMTQAIALSDILRKNGHQVPAVLIGKNPYRVVPDFVKEKMGAPILTFDSPNFVIDEKTKGIKLIDTFFYNFWHQRRFYKSISYIHKVVKEHKPDVIVNFYDLLGGLYFQFLAPNSIKKVGVGHQFLVNHSDFEYPEGKEKDVSALKANTMITGLKNHKYLALSFRPLKQEGKIHVVPPLLRKEVLESKVETGNYILAYLNNNGFAEEIIEWQKNHSEVEIHCFWDKKETEEGWSPQKNLVFHRLNDLKFLEKMKSCRGFCATAGFESICEAMYMGKPVMMVPIHNHIEQECNAIDAKKSGAGISSHFFDFEQFMNYLPEHQHSDNQQFRAWVEQAESIFLKELTEW